MRRKSSRGDSSAWLIAPTGDLTDLTAHQRRRPLLGSGEALPVIFEAELGDRRLILGSDGLCKYATAERICSLAMQGPVAEAADALACVCHLASSRTTSRSWSSHNGQKLPVTCATWISAQRTLEPVEPPRNPKNLLRS